MNNIKEKTSVLLAKVYIALNKRSTFDRLVQNGQKFQKYDAFLSFVGVNGRHVKPANGNIKESRVIVAMLSDVALRTILHYYCPNL